jgi:mgtE-like transporter
MKSRVPASAGWRQITLQSLPVLAGALVIGILAGQILASYQERLFAIPILLGLIPAVNGIGGNVGSVLGSRVASGLHFGGLWSNRGAGLRRDLTASLILTVIVFTFLGGFAYIVAPLLGTVSPVRLTDLMLTTLLAGLGLLLVMAILVIVVGMMSHRYGWDPDNVVVPVLTTAGDTLGIVFLLLAAEVVGL